MSQFLKIRLTGSEQATQFMTAEQYLEFAEKFQQQVKPALDQQRVARIRSEEDAKGHLVS